MKARRWDGPSERHQTPKRHSALFDSPWAPVLFFALLSIVYFAGGVFTNDVILGSDSGVEFHKGKEPFLEKLESFLPANWSRYMGGTPESSGLRAQYHPLTIISMFTSEHRYFLWRYIIATFCAGYFFFLCARGFGLHPIAALVTGTAFACAPAFLTFTHAGHFAKMSAICLFPLLYWSLDRGMETGRVIYFGIFSAALGIGIYTPHLQIVYFSLWALGLSFLFRLVRFYLRERDRINALRRSLLAAGAVCAGLAIGANGLLPQFLNTSTVSKRAGKEQKGGGYDYAVSWSLHPEEMAAFIIPEFGGFDVRNHRYWGRNAIKFNSEYVGIVALFFAVLSLGQFRNDPRIPFLLFLFLLAVSFTLGPHTPVHKLCYSYVPGMKVLRVPGLMAFLISFALCALAAFGLNRLLQPKPQISGAFLRRLCVGGGLVALMLILIAVNPQTLLSLWRGTVWHDMPDQRFQIALASLPDIQNGALMAALWVVLMTLLVFLRIKGKMQNSAFVVCLLGILILDTWRIDKQFLNYANPSRVLPADRVNPNVLQFLRQDKDLFRVLPIPNRQQVPLKGVDLVTGFNDFAIRRYDHIMKSGDLNHIPILNLLNTKYIVSKKRLSLPNILEVGQADGLYIYKNHRALPWFYLATDYLVETDEDRILERLRDPKHDPARVVVLEEDPPIPFVNDKTGEALIRRTDYDSHQGLIDLQVETPGPRLLVISENYHPNWRAFVNGIETRLVRANYLWKAVPLPAGNHRVELRYHDPLVAVSAWITLSSTLLLLAGAFAWMWWGRRDVKHG